MSWLVPKLRHRLQIKKPIQTPTDDGGLDQTYSTITTIWAGVREASKNSYKAFVQAIRGEQSNERETHEFIVRYNAIKYLGRGYTVGFTGGFNKEYDINNIKADYFLFLQHKNSSSGRLFRVMSIARDDERNEYMRIRAQEIEEQGTGWPD